MAIEAVSSTVDGNQPNPSPTPSSSNSKKIGIAVGITLAFVLITVIGLGIFFYTKRNKGRRGTEKNGNPNVSSVDQQGFSKAELNTDNDNAIYEMANPGNPERHAQTDAQAHQTSWVEEKSRHPRGNLGLSELNGDPTIPELSQLEPLLGPQEMYASSSIPVELAVAGPQGASELHGSNPTS